MKNWITILILFCAVFAFGQEPTTPDTIPAPPELPKFSPNPCMIYKETMPFFPGCEELEVFEKRECSEKKMLDFIYGNLKPLNPESPVEGTVVIQFTIEKDGEITQAKILRDIGEGAGKEALRVIEMMPDWEPGTQCGRPVQILYNIPIRFGTD